ncbi:phosphate acyltransferase [Psychrosphaera saromensis]|uniref:Phosphate acyltransferase n=2 Tax=Psychrosphaera saromensis TaxID=716813 RepID=A0A2S7UXN3_9GAMM|nr:phosphate acyltransferase [Psychrosphaera saromensis]GHB76311.1 phosphate acyltransferase [Psychrosphaera saromensis]GLQ14472.1 phosphate acyltransferase [Psychrosphaera saromensis]
MRDIRIALDMMGGDYGPRSTIPAAIRAVDKYPNLHLFLCGHSQSIHTFLNKHNALAHPRLTIVHTEQVVNQDERPDLALRRKPKSSMRKALELVEQEQADACVSSGNTGALLAMARYVLKTLPGIKRPALISALPTYENEKVFLLDLGANINQCADTLFQFAVMGSVMATEVEQIESPRVALLNVGSEDIKGSQHLKDAAIKLNNCKEINYVGFAEGNDIFSGKADVIVCDGFVGNVALKTIEGVSKLILSKIKALSEKSFLSRILAGMLLPGIKKLFSKMNPDQYNGASLVGLRGIVVKSHGNASSQAFFSAIKEAVKEAQRQVPHKIKDKVEQVLNDEKK